MEKYTIDGLINNLQKILDQNSQNGISESFKKCLNNICLAIASHFYK